jgi:hypothetical protein
LKSQILTARILCTAFGLLLVTAIGVVSAPASSDFENELEIVDESYFAEQGYFREEPRPRTILRGQASWAPFNVRSGFTSAHLMTEQACRSFLRNSRRYAGTACMNVHSGRVFYQVDFIGPMMP